jgi:antitoxin MazE
MRGRIIRVGNSRGLRLPAPLLEQTGLDGEVEIEANGSGLVIRPRRRPREGWDEAFAQMAAHGDDKLLELGRSPGTRWDAEEWEWR